MLQSTPMLSRQDSADTRACQQDNPALVWTHVGTVDTQSLIAAVARAYNDIYHLDTDVTPGAILGPGRATSVAQARHLCAYLLAEDYHLTNAATAHALGRADHTTALNSRARIAAALPHDTRLARVLDRARADLAGHRRADDEGLRARRDEGRRRALAAASPQDWDEYRYWRLRAGRAAMTGWEVRDGL
jgi:hypothetical protein